MPDAKEDCIWVLSNRRDDRVVLFERDDRHPGGEAFIGGSGPDFVARTAAVAAALREGTAIEIPEPPDGPKKPIAYPAPYDENRSASPGEVTPLGRALDPDVVPDGPVRNEVEAQQAAAGAEIPVPPEVVVPEPEASRVRSGRGGR